MSNKKAYRQVKYNHLLKKVQVTHAQGNFQLQTPPKWREHMPHVDEALGLASDTPLKTLIAHQYMHIPEQKRSKCRPSEDGLCKCFQAWP